MGGLGVDMGGAREKNIGSFAFSREKKGNNHQVFALLWVLKVKKKKKKKTVKPSTYGAKSNLGGKGAVGGLEGRNTQNGPPWEVRGSREYGRRGLPGNHKLVPGEKR